MDRMKYMINDEWEKKNKKIEEREMWWMVAAKTREFAKCLSSTPWISLYKP